MWGGRTLGSLVSPLTGHSPTSAGASMEHMFACSTQASLIILTVNPFVALMFRAVSFRPPGLLEHEMERIGGDGDTFYWRSG